MTFDLSVYDIFGALAAGAAIVVAESAATRDPGALVRAHSAHRRDYLESIPRTSGKIRRSALRDGFLGGTLEGWAPATVSAAITGLPA